MASSAVTTDDWPPPDPSTAVGAPTPVVPLGALGRGFDDFYDGEWRSVVGLALVLCGDRTAAEDLTQEAFTAAYRDWERVGGYDKPGAFVRRVVANKAVSRRRRLVREARAVTRLAGRRVEPARLAEPEEVWAAVRRLPARQAQIVALTYLDDLPLADAADVLGIGTETAKTHLRRARAALARALDLPDLEDLR